MLRFTLFTTLCLVIPVLAQAQDFVEKVGPRYTSAFFPGGVLDPGRKIAYISGEGGKVQAVQLATGKVLWSTAKPGLPLALSKNLLIVQDPPTGVSGNNFDGSRKAWVEVLDVKQKGKTVLKSDALIFPEWVSISLAYGRSFQSTGMVEMGKIYLAWEARAWYAGGAQPPPEVEKASRKFASGVAEVDLASGKVKMLKANELPKVKSPIPPELQKVQASPIFSERQGTMVERRMVVGDILATIDWRDKEKPQTLALRRWELKTGKELPLKKLLIASQITTMLSHDGGYVLVFPTIEKGGFQDPQMLTGWKLFDLKNGNNVGLLRREEFASDWTIVGNRAYYVLTNRTVGPRTNSYSRTLKAVDARNGRQIWTLPLASEGFLMPLP